MDDNDLGRVRSEPGSRASTEPADGLGPSGFDPSRAGPWISAEEMTVQEAGAVNHAMHARWVARGHTPPPLERNDCGWADLAAVAIKTLRCLRDSDGRPKGGDACGSVHDSADLKGIAHDRPR